ncbi:MAG: hypothetical protein V6Z81_01130 [Parvularculales bacterium]
MIEEKLEEFINDNSILYHMIGNDSWPSIKNEDLFNTSALLDTHGITGEKRKLKSNVV